MGGSPHEAAGAYVATSGNAQARAPACRRGASSAGGGAAEESHRRERHVPSSGDASRWCAGRCASCRPASHSLADVAGMVALAEVGDCAASGRARPRHRGREPMSRFPRSKHCEGRSGLRRHTPDSHQAVAVARFRYSCNHQAVGLRASGTKAALGPLLVLHGLSGSPTWHYSRVEPFAGGPFPIASAARAGMLPARAA